MASVMTYRDGGIQTGVAIKAPVMVATTGNVQLAGLQTIDGVTLAELDRVLVRAQSSAVENGIYVVRSTGWSRAKDFDGPRDVVQGTRIPVVQGDTYAGSDFVVTNSGTIIIDTTEVAFKNQAIFSDVYQGAQASDPATRNDGSALQDGDLYLNTTSGVLKVYDDSAWAATVVSASSYAATLLDDADAAEARGTLSAAKSGANTDLTSIAGLTEGSAPSTGAGKGAIYVKDTGGQPELFFREESDGDEVQITSGGALKPAQTVGTYNPTLTPGTSGSITLDTALDTLTYERTGNVVSVWGRLTVASVSSPVGRIHLSLPVTPADEGTEGSNTGAVTCWMSGMASANVADVIAIVSAANSRIEIYLGDGTSVQSDSAQQVQASTTLYVLAKYLAA